MSNESKGTILVTGATGSQGSATVKHLLERGWQVRGLTRNPDSDKSRKIAALGANVVKGDMTDRTALESAIDGVDGIYLVVDWWNNGADGEIAQGKLVSDVAKEKGVKHIVLSSIVKCPENVNVSHIGSKFALEDYINSLGIPATFLRLTVFMEDFIEKRFFPPGIWGMFYAVIGEDTEMQWVSVDDIGFVAAAVLDDAEKYAGKTINVAGDKKSAAQAYAIFCKVLGKKPFRMLMPGWFFKYCIPKGRELVHMCEAHRISPWDWDTTAVREIHPEIKDMETWLKGISEKAENIHL